MRREPDITAAAQARGDRRGQRESVASKATPRFYYERPFVVAVVFFGMAKPWGFYATAAEADAAIVLLKRDGFRAELLSG
jgi:hypothetical protein